jgi:hypothetical protein
MARFLDTTLPFPRMRLLSTNFFNQGVDAGREAFRVACGTRRLRQRCEAGEGVQVQVPPLRHQLPGPARQVGPLHRDHQRKSGNDGTSIGRRNSGFINRSLSFYFQIFVFPHYPLEQVTNFLT